MDSCFCTQGGGILQVETVLVSKTRSTELISCTKFKIHHNEVALHGQVYMPRENSTAIFLNHVQEKRNGYTILARKSEWKKRHHFENVYADWRILLKWI
jgi:hypothetical protein